MNEETFSHMGPMGKAMELIFIGDKNAQASLYYLYMMADGEVSYNEEKLFDTICKELEIDCETKSTIVEKCKEFADNNSDMYDVIINEQIDNKSIGSVVFGRTPSRSARIIWNLVNLGYADRVYSEEEQKIVKHLIDKWKVDSEIYQEFVDTADTMLALTKKKEWVLSTFNNGSEKDKKLKEIDLTMERLLSDVNLTIEELTM